MGGKRSPSFEYEQPAGLYRLCTHIMFSLLVLPFELQNIPIYLIFGHVCILLSGLLNYLSTQSLTDLTEMMVYIVVLIPCILIVESFVVAEVKQGVIHLLMIDNVSEFVELLLEHQNWLVI
jgi:hypothetical protein